MSKLIKNVKEENSLRDFSEKIQEKKDYFWLQKALQENGGG